MEQKTGNMIFFLSPVYKWLVDLFSHPFIPSFSYSLLDLLFCFGNWSLVIAPLAIILEKRREFLLSSNMEEITNIFLQIASKMRRENIPVVINSIYELCLLTDMYHFRTSITRRNGINELREGLRKDSSLGQRRSSDGTEVDEQNGVVADLCKVDNAYHTSDPFSPVSEVDSTSTDTLRNNADMGLSMQLSMHMRRISSSFKRVNGVMDNDSVASGKNRSLRNSLEVIQSDRVPSFNDFSDSNEEEEVDFNPWRDSIMEDESMSFDNLLVGMDTKGSRDLTSVVVANSANETSSDVPSHVAVQNPLKWNQSNALFRKVFKLYDDIRNQRQYNVKSLASESVVDLLSWGLLVGKWPLSVRKGNSNQFRVFRSVFDCLFRFFSVVYQNYSVPRGNIEKLKLIFFPL